MPKSLGLYLTVASFRIGPDTGDVPTGPDTWEKPFTPDPAPTGTKFLLLHFIDVVLTDDNRLEVDLGYDTDVFTASSGSEAWTRPIRLPASGVVTIRYIVDGAATGSASLEGYARGEGIITGDPSDPRHYNESNPDLFLLDSPYEEPFFETRGLCGDINWENVARLVDGSAEKDAAASACITIMVTPDPYGSGQVANACSGTLIDDDLILTAGHCFPSADSVQVASGSVCFDFQTDADGNRPAGYSPRFFKIRRMVRAGFMRADDDPRRALDYSILQIETPPAGLGLTPLPLRPDLPMVGEAVFLAHHPQGVVKKLSNQHSDPAAFVVDVQESEVTPGYYVVSHNGDVTSGSSGSSLLDATGAVLGVNDWGAECENGTLSSATIRRDFGTEPPPPRARDVMLLIDRSGSMSLPGSVEGTSKMQQAQAAASLFVHLVRSDAGHRAGLVSFSTNASADFALQDADASNKEILTGPAPYTGGLIGGLSAAGTTSIGHALEVGQAQFPGASIDANRPHFLLLTDGLENTPPMIDEAERGLGETRMCIVGFGSEASLNGPLLARLARDHDGRYTRADSGLELQKFFVLCFGNIFETGSSLDPEGLLPADENRIKPIPLDVCGEDSLTVVVGWDRPAAHLTLGLEAPGGTVISATTPGAVAASGTTWAFIRLALPFAGAGDGRWLIHVLRGGGSVEFPPPPIAVRYFVSTVIKGGAYLRSMMDDGVFHTGDVLNPRVVLRYPSGAIPRNASVHVTVTAPAEGTGNLLSEAGIGEATVVDGDRIDPRSSRLIELERDHGGPLITTTTHSFQLFDDGAHDDGAMEPDGIFANPLADITRHEGHYSFHVRAQYGQSCSTIRETTWSVYVGIGIDHDNTEVDTQPTGDLVDGRRGFRITIVPKDRYRNRLGPGRLAAFELYPQPGSEALGPVRDAGNGSYELDLGWTPGSAVPPGLVLTQPDKPPMALCGVTGTVKPCSPCWGIKSPLFWLLVIVILLLMALLIGR